MAVRSVATTSTLEGFRTTFNSLGTDVGDLGLLGTTDTSSIVAAINEVNTAVTTAWTIADDTSTTQTISTGDVFRISGTSNQVVATVSATDTLTIALASTISGLTSISATTLTDGTASISSGAITGVTNVTASGTITFSGLGAASIDTDAFLVSDSNVIKTRTGAQVLSDIGGASTGFAIAQAVALG